MVSKDYLLSFIYDISIHVCLHFYFLFAASFISVIELQKL